MHWQWRKLRAPYAGDAIACGELCGPGCSTNRSQLPPLPFCQHLKGIVKILLHSLTVPGRTLPLLVSRLLLLSQIFDDTGIATSGGKKPNKQQNENSRVCYDNNDRFIIWNECEGWLRSSWIPSFYQAGPTLSHVCLQKENPLYLESVGDFCQHQAGLQLKC